MKTRAYTAKSIALMLLALIFTGCRNGSREDVHFARLEQVIFDTPSEELAPTLRSQRSTFDTPLLNIDPDDGQLMAMLADFAADTSMRYIYGVCDSMYHDLSWLEHEIGRALGRCDAAPCKRFYTFVSGDFEDYSRRVTCYAGDLAISLDHYAVAELGAGVPTYIERVSRKEYMATDCMAAIARAHIAMPADGADPTLLDQLIAEGKVLYFLEQTMPDAHDTIRLRYTADQLRWARQHVEQVWAFLLKDGLLFSTDIGQYHNLIDEAPKTNAFGEGSAPRTPYYIGWQIVRAYMKRSGATMAELFEETDSRRILTASGWRP